MHPERTDPDPGARAACPGEDSIVRFVEGALSADEEDSLRAHIDVCAACRRRVAEVGAGGNASSPVTEDEQPRTREASREATIEPGALVGGKYRIARLIGAGGMGKVFAATHVDLGHTVAVKIMHPDMARDADSVKRFLREGRAAALLKSDHAARINDVGRLPSGIPYLIMEYLEGEDLDRHRKRVTMSADDVVDYMLQALSAIAEAHAAGLVHRDIKPQNLFLAQLPDGRVRVKVLDFGLAKELPTLHRSNSALTTDNMILGSPHFMSPEQIRNPMKVDGRTDIWAVGATMYMLLTGRPPFTSSTTHGLLARILSDPLSPARDLRGDVSPALDAVIDRCMAKDVNARFQSVVELSIALRSLTNAPATRGAVDSRSAAALAPPTVFDSPPTLDASAAEQDLGVTIAQTLPVPTQHAGVPPTAPMGTFPLASPIASAPPGPVSVAPPKPYLKTLTSEPMYQARSLPPEEPAMNADSVTAPKPSSGRRAATVALVVVTLAAAIVVVLGIRAARAHGTPTPAAEHGDIRAIDPTVHASAVAAPSAAPTTTSVEPTAPSAASSASPPVTQVAPATSVPKRTPRVSPPVATSSATKDPYSWGK